MNTKQMRTAKKVRVVISLVILVLTFAGNSAKAQKAPPFSNDIMMDNQTYFFFMADRFEFYNVDGGPLVFDTQGYIGKDINKFWFEAEGDALTAQQEGEVELQGLYSRAISSYFDVQVGIRYDVLYDRLETLSRGFAVIGLQGLAPYLFELDTNLFISEAGDISGDFEAEYEFPVTQRLWGQPRLETSVAAQEVERFGVGSGFNNIQFGFRLRYEIEREFAPYVGISWNQKLGETADFARAEGSEASLFGVVGGVRLWF